MKIDWKPANEAPYNELCLFVTVDGNIVEGFIYDGDAQYFGYTHYADLPPLPADACIKPAWYSEEEWVKHNKEISF